RNILTCGVAIALAACGSMAIAQDSCEAPVTIHTDEVITGASTCGRLNGVSGFGAIASPYPDYIYSFVADSASATIDLNSSGPLLVYLVDSCAAGAAGSPIGGGVTGTPMTVNGLTDGQQYWVVVSTQPTQG